MNPAIDLAAVMAQWIVNCEATVVTDFILTKPLAKYGVLKWTRARVLICLYDAALVEPDRASSFIAKGICRWRHGYNDLRNLTAMVIHHQMRRFRSCVKTRVEPISCRSHAAASTVSGATANPEVLSKRWLLDGGGQDEHDLDPRVA
jgi:hypothetical protein